MRPWNEPGRGDNVGATGQPGEFQGRFAGLGPGVGEEDPATGCRSAVSRYRQQPLGQFDLRLRGEEVGDVAEGEHLLMNGLDQCRVGVTERIDRDAGVQVEVLLAVDIPDPGTLTARKHEFGRPEGVHQRAVVPLGPLRTPRAHDSLLGTAEVSPDFRADFWAFVGLADLGRCPGKHLGPDALVCEEFEKYGVRLTPVDHGCPCHSPTNRIETGLHLGHHPALEFRHQHGQRFGANLLDHVVTRRASPGRDPRHR